MPRWWLRATISAGVLAVGLWMLAPTVLGTDGPWAGWMSDQVLKQGMAEGQERSRMRFDVDPEPVLKEHLFHSVEAISLQATLSGVQLEEVMLNEDSSAVLIASDEVSAEELETLVTRTVPGMMTDGFVVQDGTSYHRFRINEDQQNLLREIVVAQERQRLSTPDPDLIAWWEDINQIGDTTLWARLEIDEDRFVPDTVITQLCGLPTGEPEAWFSSTYPSD